LEDYVSNSNKSRDNKIVETQPEKNVPSISTNGATIQPKTGFDKFKESIIAEDLNSVGSWLFHEVIITSCKKVIFDIVTNGIDMLLYGKASGIKPSNSVNGGTKISYGSYYSGPKLRSSERQDNQTNRIFNYSNIIFPDRGSAEEALSDMDEVVDSCGAVSIADLYEIAKIDDVPDYTYNDYGWTSVRDVQVLRCTGGYLLKLPKAKYIK